jgi:hypothetical protein
VKLLHLEDGDRIRTASSSEFLEIAAMKERSDKRLRPLERREAVRVLQDRRISAVRACNLIGCKRSNTDHRRKPLADFERDFICEWRDRPEVIADRPRNPPAWQAIQDREPA